MKKTILLTVLIFGFLAAPALATLTLGWWEEEHPRAVTAIWDFTDAEPDIGGLIYKYAEYPATFINPQGGGKAFIGTPDSTTYSDGAIRDNTSIVVSLELGNIKDLNAHKEIWVDVDFDGEITGYWAAGDTAGVEHTTVNLPGGTNPGVGIADFGFRIYPNPWKEDIQFTIYADGQVASLTSIRVDTICIPEPMTICLLGLGGLVVISSRKRNIRLRKS